MSDVERITFDDLNIALDSDPLHLRDMAWRFLRDRDQILQHFEFDGPATFYRWMEAQGYGS